MDFCVKLEQPMFDSQNADEIANQLDKLFNEIDQQFPINKENARVWYNALSHICNSLNDLKMRAFYMWNADRVTSESIYSSIKDRHPNKFDLSLEEWLECMPDELIAESYSNDS